VLIIDEAQNLTEDLLEQVRLLSNIETDDRKLLQIVLLGQPELRDRLNSPRLRQLRQRITVRYHLAPLTRSRSANTSSTGWNWPARRARRFSRSPALWRFSITAAAFPRLVNAVCDKALLAGFVERSDRITYRMVGRAIRELEGKHPRMSLINDALKLIAGSRRSLHRIIPVQTRPTGRRHAAGGRHRDPTGENRRGGPARRHQPAAGSETPGHFVHGDPALRDYQRQNGFCR
jgi:hypothetical protein